MNTVSELPQKAIFVLAVLVVLGSGAFLFGEAGDPQRIGANFLVATYGLLGLGLGGVVLLALLFVTGARWSDSLRPVVERLARLLPVGGIGVAIVLCVSPSLYPWTDVASEPASPFQAIWLYRPFFLLRAFVYLALWLGLGFLLVRASQRQDARAADSSRVASVRFSALFLVVFALTCGLACTDWIMSLEPKWSSTVFGIYQFAGMFLGALAAVIILAIWLDHRGALGGRLTRDHRRDLGTLLFGFSSFWMYIWFSQYLLIWFVNNPEESDYYVLRQQEPWQPLVIANLVLGWAVPFLVLLMRPTKESSVVLLTVAVTVLVGRWLDLYLMVLPPVVGPGAAPVGWDAALLLGTATLGALILTLRLPRTAGQSGEIS
jgi:hypothetical protein